ncbi:sensor histidine kinase [Nocardioides rubriscoriae]|uniref:sensor histidine kinase n=1 Tax=Nocardioides rubriscoriae TaxID=642762 RepID=UPI0011DFC63E|nr:histidine kinase [Nocardioides rubriscoriae]
MTAVAPPRPLFTWLAPPVPWRYLVFSVAASALLLVMGFNSQWVPWDDGLTSLSGTGWSDLAASVSMYLWAVAPALALWRPAVGGTVAAMPFLITLGDSAKTWPLVLFVSLLACAVTATWRSRRAAVVLAGAAMVPVATYAAGRTTIVTGYGFEVERGAASLPNLAFQLLLYALVAAAAVGLGAWMRASYLASQSASALAGRAEAVERESAVVGERARLARDLHDVVAHHVSLIAVRAETAPYTVTDLSPGAAALLSEIADDSRRALDELRGVLGILGRSTVGAELAPQPGATDIAALVEAARRGGDDVVCVPTDLSGVAAAPGYVAYRVVQEALTNARRHAPGATIRLDVTAVGGGVLVRVDNELVDDALAADGLVVDGNGLAGMRERVEALGGTLSVSSGEGRLRVEASIPAEAP